MVGLILFCDVSDEVLFNEMGNQKVDDKFINSRYKLTIFQMLNSIKNYTFRIMCR